MAPFIRYCRPAEDRGQSKDTLERSRTTTAHPQNLSPNSTSPNLAYETCRFPAVCASGVAFGSLHGLTALMTTALLHQLRSKLVHAKCPAGLQCWQQTPCSGVPPEATSSANACHFGLLAGAIKQRRSNNQQSVLCCELQNLTLALDIGTTGDCLQYPPSCLGPWFIDPRQG